jgi:hypothetical protein
MVYGVCLVEQAYQSGDVALLGFSYHCFGYYFHDTAISTPKGSEFFSKRFFFA